MNSSPTRPFANPLVERLRTGGLCLSLQVRHAYTVEIALAARACGFDVLYFDFQHTAVREESAAQIAVAAHGIGVTPLVRIPEGDYGMALRMLDAGMLGIIVPDVSSAEGAAHAVACCKFPPLGHRSASAGWPHFGYRPMPAVEATEAMNANTVLILMVESKAALDNVDAIAAVPGVDIVHVGSNDLAADLGVPGQLSHPQVIAATEHVIAACRRHGKTAGVGGLAGGDVKRIEHVVKLGARFLTAGNEWSLMLSAGQERVRAIRAWESPGS